MKIIKSCGFVVYTDVFGERRYLVIESVNGDVGFPKGHAEAGESELETAIRELREEVGINAVIGSDTVIGSVAVADGNSMVGADAVNDCKTAIDNEADVMAKSATVYENKGVQADAVVVDGFCRRVEYMMPGMTDAVKQVVYFLCRCFNTDVLKCQETEVRSAEFMTFDDASEALTFREMKEILSDAEKFLSRR